MHVEYYLFGVQTFLPFKHSGISADIPLDPQFYTRIFVCLYEFSCGPYKVAYLRCGLAIVVVAWPVLKATKTL